MSAATAADWQVYILKCADGSLYTGITTDIEQRLTAHNAGKGAKYTRGRLPVKLLYAEPADNRATASQREAAIKKMNRAAKLRLIS
jgi:putative endonuclease